MKTENLSSGSEGSYSSDDDRGVASRSFDGESDRDGDELMARANKHHQYQEYDVNKFWNQVWGGFGNSDQNVKRIGKLLRKACEERDLVQLIQGTLHLVELYQADKTSRARAASEGNEKNRGNERTRAESLKNFRKGTVRSRKAMLGRRRRRRDAVRSHQGRNKFVDAVNLEEDEENVGTFEADRSNQAQDENDNDDLPLQDVESTASSKHQGNQLPHDEEEEEVLSVSDLEEQEEGGNINEDPVDNPVDTLPDIDSEEGEIIEEPLRSQQKRKARYSEESISEDEPEDDSSRIDPPYRDEGERTLIKQRGNRNLPQKKIKPSEDVPSSTDEEDSEDESESGEDSSSSSNISQDEEDSIKKRSIKRKYKCPVCKKVLSTKGNLKIHSSVHSEERPFTCPRPGCGKTYKGKNGLASHLRAHAGIKPYKCAYPRCKKVFATWTALDTHKRFHTGERPFKCDHPGCFMDFASQSSCRRHKKTHAARRQGPYKCPYSGCEKAYTDRSGLRYHRKRTSHK